MSVARERGRVIAFGAALHAFSVGLILVLSSAILRGPSPSDEALDPSLRDRTYTLPPWVLPAGIIALAASVMLFLASIGISRRSVSEPSMTPRLELGLLASAAASAAVTSVVCAYIERENTSVATSLLLLPIVGAMFAAYEWRKARPDDA